MTKSKEKGSKPQRATADWESIERLYRAGVLSIREIAKIHEVSDTAIRKKAKELGWERDLTAKVQAKARDELVRASVRTALTRENLRTERDIIEEAALTVVAVVREHRSGIATARRIVAVRSGQLLAAAGQRDALEVLIEEETAADASSDRRNKLYKAISLPSHATTARDLSMAMKNLIALERQAFNVPDVTPDDPPAGGDGNALAKATEGMEALRAAFAKRLGRDLDPPAK